MSEEYSLEDLLELQRVVEAQLENVRTWSNIGKFDFRYDFKKWENRQPVEIGMSEYQALKKKGQNVTGQVVISVGVMEFNPETPKDFVRYLRFDEGSYAQKLDDGTKVVHKDNWRDIFAASIMELTGEKAWFHALEKLQGKYVDIREVDANLSYQIDKKEGYAKYSKVFAVFDSREAAYDAYLNKTGSGETSDATESIAKWIPEGWKGSTDDFDACIPYIKEDDRPAPIIAKDYNEMGLTVSDITKIKEL